ncbi:5918_t:CDS:2, partial [Paraglomus occultum]
MVGTSNSISNSLDSETFNTMQTSQRSFYDANCVHQIALPPTSYDPHYVYESYNYGRIRSPSTVSKWSSFMQDAKHTTVIPNYDFRLPAVPPRICVTAKEDLVEAMDYIVMNILAHLPEFRYTSRIYQMKSIDPAAISPVDWQLHSKTTMELITFVALRTEIQLSTQCKLGSNIIHEYQKNIGDFKTHIDLVYDYMVEKELRYGVLTTYERTWFLKRSESDPSHLLVSDVQMRNSRMPTLIQALYYIFQLASTDNVCLPSMITPESSEDFPVSVPMPIEEDTVSCESTASLEEVDTEIGPIASSTKDAVIWKEMLWHKQEAGRGANGIIYRVFYRGREIALKYHPTGDMLRTDYLRHEVHVYQKLQNLQGVYIPSLVHHGYSLDGEMYVVCTNYIKRACSLQRRHEEDAIRAVSAIHRLGVLHNDIRPDNILVGIDEFSPTGERIFVIDFHLSLIDNDYHPIHASMFEEELYK